MKTNGRRRLNWWGGLLALLVPALILPALLQAEEGMYPISEIDKLDLQARGLELRAEELFSTDETCLVDGICRVNGCTGSFVSPQGLIITNHHCAYRAIQSASTEQNDYLADGFQAANLAAEIPAKGYTVRITEGYEDVSAQVLSVTSPDMDFTERTKAIERQMKTIEQQAEQSHPGMRAEVAEMFIGKTYMLFLYTYIKDVRLVFAPPASVGNFGGEIDNWEWPRHTGDFSFMRAYVAPDGSSAEYSEDNVPYEPKRHVQVAADGVSEGDFVMLLGYPGRTARHKTADFLKYERDVRLPGVVEFYQWQIQEMEEAGQEDRAVALKHASRMRSLANVEKRSRGQLKGLRRAAIVELREAEEAELQEFIEGDPARNSKYGTLLPQIAEVYAEMADTYPAESMETGLFSAPRLLYLAFTVYDAAIERQKPDLERESEYMDRNFDQTSQRLALTLQDLDRDTDLKMLAGLAQRLKAQGIEGADSVQFAADPAELEAFYEDSKLTDAAFLAQALEMTPAELQEVEDPALQLAVQWYERLMEIREKDKQREGRLNQLYGDLIEIKKQFLSSEFVPDANGTLRLTMGKVEGYSPEDAVYKMPLTSLQGVLDKTTGEEPFVTPEALLDAFYSGEFGEYVHPELQQVPVNILYSTDTTGGNSGSPIFNSKGQLVGVNFDRAFEATINDFAWNQSYSRSIGVDVRYVLWITGTVFKAEHLLEEMGVQ